MFIQAKPVFPVGRTNEKNVFAAFRAETPDLKGTVLLVTACYFYRVYVNGAFVAFGPARTAKGFTRVDVLPLDSYNQNGANEIVIEVIGHNCRSLSTVYQPSFLQTELRSGDEVLLATGRDFEGYLPKIREQKVKRYSVQRHFHEVWDYLSGFRVCDPKYRAELEIVENAPTPIERRAPYPYYEDVMLSSIASAGITEYDETRRVRPTPYSKSMYNEWWQIFTEDEIRYRPREWLESRRQIKAQGQTVLPVTLEENGYVIFDFGHIETGFIKLSVTAEEDTELAIGFSEDASPDEFSFTDINAYNAHTLLVGKGREVDWMSFEPYVGRFFCIGAVKGKLQINAFGIKTFIHNPNGMLLSEPEDSILSAVFRGAVRTFNHNALDIYMDCPSRERGGWLCDSYFTGKTEYALYGSTQVEDAFLENYRLYKNEGEYPEGALPMVYPSDHQESHKFIPQWTMWYILELEEYLNKRGHGSDKELFRHSVDSLLAFYKRYENADGLLERLPSWNFIEWSRANQWCHDVNYPTNFLYAAALEAAYRIYGDESLLIRANEVRKKTIEQSFDGEKFYDHAVYDGNGKLILQTSDCSEIAQYYAILFGGVDINCEKYARLRHLVTKLCYADSAELPENMEPINAFIGVYLRLEALLHMKEYDLVLKDVREFFGEMEEITGTLWEYRQRRGSRDHGFASYALVAIWRALNKN